ncbi:hypothetical protein PX52LOC_01901 [Limnoglobus roseus]|uniref:Uncharacterized protein n=2 Tax=Limnoglobus roseus TaxID=2598579 RepID=A0A5C1AAE6_9BACT|nr:hypothetical protein PX52LOC_01901 [Limnoglobus roseus]
MGPLWPSDISHLVRDLLMAADDGTEYVSAVQILERLPPAVRERLIAESKAFGVVTDAAHRVDGVEIEYFDREGRSVSAVLNSGGIPDFSATARYRFRPVE